MKTASLLFPFLILCLSGCAQNHAQKATIKHAPLGNFAGINGYEWDFEAPANAQHLDSGRLAAIQNFSGFRHYLDWEKLEYTEGSYTFNPAFNGGWNYDTIYQWCKNQHIEVLVCLKTIPKWLENTYPEGQRNAENVPARYGSDRSAPASYIEQARLGFQFAARYGSNPNVDLSLLHVNNKPRWTGDRVNEIKTGMGVVQYIECDNERDKWWKGPQAKQSPQEYAANLSAFYDGDKGKLGPAIGVKNADPSMKVVMAGLAEPDPHYVEQMIAWCKTHRGLLKDGSVDLPWDIINYHYYCNDANGSQRDRTTGVAPELTTTEKVTTDFVAMAHTLAGNRPVWVTETGYDLNPNSPQRAVPIGNKPAQFTQADWILRTSLLYARAGIQKVFFYQLYDDNANSPIQYGTSGIVNADHSPRPAAEYLKQMNTLFGNYTYQATIQKDPIIDRYTFGNKNMYMVVNPDSKGRTASVTLDLGNAPTAYICLPKAGSMAMSITEQKTIQGKLTFTATETPTFVTIERP